MLIFPLKKEWYEKIRSGEKRIEYREVKPYWSKRIYSELRSCLIAEYGEKARKRMPSLDVYEETLKSDPVVFGDGTEPKPVVWACKLRLGYTNRYMAANITKIEVVDGKDTDLRIDKPVYAIHLANVREEEQ